MKAHFEKVPASSSRSFYACERVDREFPFNWHYHPEVELTLIIDSAGQRFVGDRISDYGPLDLVLVGSNLPHTWRSGPLKFNARELHRAVVIQFREELLNHEFLSLEGMPPIGQLIKRAACGLGFQQTRAGVSVTPKIRELPFLSPGQRLLSLMSILLELAFEPDAAILSGRGGPQTFRLEDQNRVNRICSYLNSHSAEKINFGKVARLANMNQAALCRFFKKATHRTLTEYVNETRVSGAAQLLIDTDLSLLEIALHVGFANYSNFCRQFRRLKGCSPRSLRHDFRSIA